MSRYHVATVHSTDATFNDAALSLSRGSREDAIAPGDLVMILHGHFKGRWVRVKTVETDAKQVRVVVGGVKDDKGGDTVVRDFTWPEMTFREY